MKSLLEIYHENVEQKSLFSEVIDIDFYDGPTEALCRLANTEQWVICSLVYIDFNERERIFTLLGIDNDVLLSFKSIFENRPSDQEDFYESLKEQVKVVYTGYAGRVFLFKGDWLNAIKYEVVEISLKDLQYFRDIEMVIEQSEDSKIKWERCFPST